MKRWLRLIALEEEGLITKRALMWNMEGMLPSRQAIGNESKILIECHTSKLGILDNRLQSGNMTTAIE